MGFIITAPIKVSAKTLVFSDDFSAGLNKWESVRPYPELWSINASGQAQAYIPYPSIITEMVPKDEYWDSRWQNIELNFDYYTYEGGDKNIGFGYTNSQNWYELHFAGQTYELVKVKNGAVVWSVWHGGGLYNGRHYQVKLVLVQGQISLWLDGQLISTDTDPDYQNDFGKITLKAGTGAVSPTSVSFDNIAVYWLDDIDLPSYVFKQTDPAWASKTYDTAQLWSPTDSSIQRWGCALSSLAMIMRYHQINFLPDGQTLNPDTLNTWLNSQPDGYLAEGLVNWQAGARLAKLIHQTYGTTKLEYRFLAQDQIPAVNQNITQHKPVIVAIPGHFLLADGLTTDQTDWTIRDPAYAYSLFSQHGVVAESFRLLTPSQTDLSYVIITHSPEVKVKLIGSEVADNQVQTYTEYLAADGDQSQLKNKNLTITQLAKPQAGQYQVQLSQNKLAKTSLKFYLYDIAGNVKVIDRTWLIGSMPTSLNLQLDTADVGQSQLTGSTLTFQTWAELLTPLYQNRNIKRQFAITILHNTALTASQNPTTSADQFINYLHSLLDWLSPVMTDAAKSYLDQELDRISVI